MFMSIRGFGETRASSRWCVRYPHMMRYTDTENTGVPAVPHLTSDEYEVLLEEMIWRQ